MNRHRFDEDLAKGRLKIAFVGMSNTGKTTRSVVLKDSLGFHGVDVDGEICTALGLADMDALAAWMGYPDSEGYAEREKKYLEMERKSVTKERITNGNLVIDTTGS